MNDIECKLIIVTHNSESHIQWLLSGLESSVSVLKIHIVDSGSANTEYLENLNSKHQITIDKRDNIGFVQGNNSALNDIELYKWVLFINPDARIEGEDLDKLLCFCNNVPEKQSGVFTVPLRRFDIGKKIQTGYYDSKGITCNWYGKWFDISSGEKITSHHNEPEFCEVEAVCGAFMLLRSSLLINYLDKKGGRGFENSYHMYKEDIELSLRIKNQGLKNIIFNEVFAFHCRGWSKKRKEVAYWAKFNSAKNDIDIALRFKLRALPYSLIKYIWVRLVESKS